MSWWDSNDLRLIQTNLREPDATLDFDRLFDRLADLRANVWLMNVGGIAAFYPTDLEYHYQNPHVEGDPLAEGIEHCRERDMRLMARFDFSKAHESIFAERPEWFYRDAEGEPVNYHGIVHTCVNGGYQREYSLRILEEVLSSYDVDGIFFNMFGYQHWDYDGTYHGICRCANCRERFRELFDRELPEEESEDDPAYRDYQRFQRITTRELLENVRELVDTYDSKIAVSTYATHGVDIVKDESNTSLDRAYEAPGGKLWPYSASENVASIEDSYEEKLVSNVCINATALQYRFHGVSEHEVAIRLYQSIAAGSGLDFCINGVFEGYPDRGNFEAVGEVFRFHAENERYFGDLESVADVALVKPETPPTAARGVEREQVHEYLGAFKALKEAHVPFDVIRQGRLEALAGDLTGYDLLLLPDVRSPSEGQLDVLTSLAECGVGLIGTNRTLAADGGPRERLESLFGARYERTTSETRGSYVDARDKGVFDRLADQDWVLVDGEFSEVSFAPGTKTYLPYLTPGTFGPPERVGHEGNEESGYYGMGVLERDPDGGTGDTSGRRIRTALLPWQVGMLYYHHGFAAHKRILLDAIERLLAEEHPLTTDAPETVEVFFDRIADGHLLQFVNLSGFNGVSYFEPDPVVGIETLLSDVAEPSRVRTLTDGSADWTFDRHGLRVELDRLDEYAAVLIED